MDMDEKLMFSVNILGVVTFLAIVFYHFITATPKVLPTQKVELK